MKNVMMGLAKQLFNAHHIRAMAGLGTTNLRIMNQNNAATWAPKNATTLMSVSPKAAATTLAVVCPFGS